MSALRCWNGRLHFPFGEIYSLATPVTAYKDFTLRGTEWVSTQGPSGPWGVRETAVFSSPLYDSHGQAIRFNRYQTRHSVTKKQAPRCPAGEDKQIPPNLVVGRVRRILIPS